jgi:hypothetical protein
VSDAGDIDGTDDTDEESLAAEERVADAAELDDLTADQDETAFDETRLEYSGVEEGDGDVDVEEYEEAGALFDDPEKILLLDGGIDDPDGADG